MSLAWATIALIVFLLPGIFFFIGLASYERLSREIIRSGVVSEVAMASAIALAIHFFAISVLSAFGFRLSHFIEPLAEYQKIATEVFVQRVSDRLMPMALYLACTTLAGFCFGLVVAINIVSGRFRRQASHAAGERVGPSFHRRQQYPQRAFRFQPRNPGAGRRQGSPGRGVPASSRARGAPGRAKGAAEIATGT